MLNKEKIFQKHLKLTLIIFATLLFLLLSLSTTSAAVDIHNTSDNSIKTAIEGGGEVMFMS